jgi:hypothetical protein
MTMLTKGNLYNMTIMIMIMRIEDNDINDNIYTSDVGDNDISNERRW